MDFLVDTNVWLRALATSHPMKPVARHAIKTLLRDGAGLYVTPQNPVELWSVCTRPERDNGFGKATVVTDRYCRFIESFSRVLPETVELFIRWRELVIAYNVCGKKVFDARLVAAMGLHRVDRILTFNTKDFTRYKGIVAISPETL